MYLEQLHAVNAYLRKLGRATIFWKRNVTNILIKDFVNIRYVAVYGIRICYVCKMIWLFKIGQHNFELLFLERVSIIKRRK